MTLNEFLDAQGSGAVGKLARRLGVSSADVSNWRHGRRAVPIVRAVDIEAATDGAVTRKELRPEDWRRIWPELAEKTAA